MKVTIEHEGLTASVEDPKAVTLAEALDLIEYTLRGIGFNIEMETLTVRDEE